MQVRMRVCQTEVRAKFVSGAKSSKMLEACLLPEIVIVDKVIRYLQEDFVW